MSGSKQSHDPYDSYPPASSPACEGIRLSLSEYVDGVLPEPRALEIQSHLEVCSTCLAVVATYKRIQSVCERTESLEEPDFWSSISQTLQSDQRRDSLQTKDGGCGFDAEFVFAYVDGEEATLETSTEVSGSEIEAFESHLFACMPCNEKIADADALSMLLKAWHVRLEERLENELQSFNLPHIVLSAYQASENASNSTLQDEETDILAVLKPCDVVTWEALSGYLDHELSQTEQQSLSSHLCTCEPCTKALKAFQQAQTVYQAWSQRLEASAPEFTVSVMQAYRSGEHSFLDQAAKESTILTGPTRWFKFALPTLAAAVLLLVMATRSDLFSGGELSEDSARVAQSAPIEIAASEVSPSSAAVIEGQPKNPPTASISSTDLPSAQEDSSAVSPNKPVEDLAGRADLAQNKIVTPVRSGALSPIRSEETNPSDALPSRAGSGVITAAPPAAQSSPATSYASLKQTELDADRQHSEMADSTLAPAQPARSGFVLSSPADKPQAKAKNDRLRNNAQPGSNVKKESLEKESKIAFGLPPSGGTVLPTAPRQQRSAEKIAYIPSAEEYLYAQHRRSIHSHEMSAMMGGEGSP